MPAVQTVLLEGKEYVVLPKAEYLRLADSGAPVPYGSVDAIHHAEAEISGNLRRAREAAGLTQEELAARLGKSQAMVSGAENGRVRVSSRYVAAVLKACDLPEDWPSSAAPKPPSPPRPSGRPKGSTPAPPSKKRTSR